MGKKYVYQFAEGNAKMRELLGGKGANLAEMTNIGLPVPYGFTITTEACTQYYEDGKQINDDIKAEIMENIAKLEEKAGRKFVDKSLKVFFADFHNDVGEHLDKTSVTVPSPSCVA